MWCPCMQGLTLLSLLGNKSHVCPVCSHLAKLLTGLVMFAFIFHDLRNVKLFHYGCRHICCFYIGQGFIVWSFFAAILVNDQYIIVVNYSFSQYKKNILVCYSVLLILALFCLLYVHACLTFIGIVPLYLCSNQSFCTFLC